MVYSIDNLIQQCGKQTAMDILPSLFIKINTSSAVEKMSMLDYEYDVFFNISSYMVTNELIKAYINKENSTEYVQELMSVISLFYNCRNSIDSADVDYIVISYLGDFQVRFKNKSATDKPYGKSLYLDMQSLRIALIDEYTMQIWRRNYMVFRNGIKMIGGYFAFNYVLNYFGINYYNWRGLIGI